MRATWVNVWQYGKVTLRSESAHKARLSEGALVLLGQLWAAGTHIAITFPDISSHVTLPGNALQLGRLDAVHVISGPVTWSR
jgi:hypothetical protein